MANGNNGTSGHEQELVDVQDLKATLKKGGNKGLFNEASCSTAAATAAKTVTAPTSFTLVSGAKIIVTFTNAITVANATLAVGDTAAKPIYFRGAALAADIVKAGTSLLLSYDGTAYNIIGGLGGDLLAGDGINISNSEVSVDETVARFGPNGEGTILPEYVAGTFTGSCSTAADTAAKTLDITGYELVRKSSVAVKFNNGISAASATLNISSKGAKPIYYKGSALAAGVVKANDIITMVYNGTQYEVISIESAPKYSRIYTAITSPTGNPATQGWYELSNGEYVLTSDTTVTSGKTYYKQTDYYSMTI